MLKPGPLTSAEMEAIRRHVALGVGVVANSGWLRGARDVVGFHHEKFDGSGYLKGLAGGAIPLAARIFAIVDVFDALTSRRPYKEALAFEEAMTILERGRGRHFDPALLDVFRGIAAEIHGKVSARDDSALRRIVRARVAEYFLLADEAARGWTAPRCPGRSARNPVARIQIRLRVLRIRFRCAVLVRLRSLARRNVRAMRAHMPAGTADDQEHDHQNHHRCHFFLRIQIFQNKFQALR